MSRTPTTPFIPPLLSPHPSPQPQPSPVIPAYTPLTAATHYPAYPSTSPYTSSPFIPPSPSELHSGLPPAPTHSRQNSRQGVSADYTGYPLGAYPPQGSSTPVIPPPLQSQTLHPMHGPPHGYPPHPYSAPGPYGTFLQAGQTPWMPPPQQLQSPYGPPPHGRAPPGPGAYGTPYTPYGAPLPPPHTPAAAPAWGMHTPGHQSYYDPNAWYGPQAPANVPAYSRPPPEPPAQVYDRIDPFMTGPHYSPVLEPIHARILNVSIRLNPLISPLQENGPERPFIKWDMALASETAQRSDEPSHLSWQKGRAQPATFPRLTSLNIVSHHYPWVIKVRAKDPDNGVTCGEVIDSISADVYRMSSKSDYEILSTRDKMDLGIAYKYNRSPIPGVPGGRIGQGMRRLDFLRRYTLFAGIDIDDRVVKRVCDGVLPCTFVLMCAPRANTEKELQELEERMRHTTLQNAPAPRSASRNPGGRSRASSVSTRISVHAPTSTSYDTGTDTESGDYD